MQKFLVLMYYFFLSPNSSKSNLSNLGLNQMHPTCGELLSGKDIDFCSSHENAVIHKVIESAIFDNF